MIPNHIYKEDIETLTEIIHTLLEFHVYPYKVNPDDIEIARGNLFNLEARLKEIPDDDNDIHDATSIMDDIRENLNIPEGESDLILVPNRENDPFFVKKAEEAKEFMKNHPLPVNLEPKYKGGAQRVPRKEQQDIDNTEKKKKFKAKKYEGAITATTSETDGYKRYVDYMNDLGNKAITFGEWVEKDRAVRGTHIIPGIDNTQVIPSKPNMIKESGGKPKGDPDIEHD